MRTINVHFTTYSKILFLSLTALVIVVIYASITGSLWFSPYGVGGAIEAKSVYDIAIQNKDISICDKVHMNILADVSSDELRSVCYERYARANPHQEICSRIGNDFRCVFARSWALNDPTICLSMGDEGDKALCVAYIAKRINSANTCKILQSSESQNKCIAHMNSNI